MGLLGAVAISKTLRSELATNALGLPKIIKYILAAIGLLAIISSVSARNSWDVTIFGLAPEYLGFVPWVLFFGLGVLFSRVARTLLLSRTALYSMAAVVMASVVSDRLYLGSTYRLTGALFQSTTMAIYALVVCVLALHQLTTQAKKHTALHGLILTLSVVAVMLCQSRIGILVLVLLIAAWAIKLCRHKPRLAVVLLAITLAVLVLPSLQADYFARLRGGSVSYDASFREKIYITAVPDLLQNHLLLGKGASSLPEGLNNSTATPPVLAGMLNQGYVFFSAHNLYLDFAYFFGCLAAFGLVAVTGTALIYGYRTYKKSPTLLFVFGVLVSNALVNVPSIEMTSLLFITVFALLNDRRKHSHQKLS